MPDAERTSGVPGQIRHSAIRREALRVAPGRPDLRAGLRAALATTVPLVLAGVFQRSELAVAALAGFGSVLADKGGAYRTRALSMGSVGLFGALATGAGMLAAHHPVASALMVALTVAMTGLLRLFGAEAAGVGTMLALSMVVALSRPAPTLTAAALHAGVFVLGSAWAMLISLVFWPLRVYRPARFAIAAAMRALAAVARSLIEASPDPAAQFARRQQLGAARTAIEAARGQLGSLRKARVGSTTRGERLVAVIEAADLVMGALVAIEDSLAFEPPQNLPQLSRWIEQVAGHIEGELERLAEALELERTPAQSSRLSLTLAQTMRKAAESVEDHEPRILARALERTERLVELSSAVDDPHDPHDPNAPRDPRDPHAVDRAELSAPTTQASRLALVYEHLSLDSAMFRHVIRSTVATSVTMLSVNALGLGHGYWATLTCLVIMQPHGSQTWAKALQRVLGTVLGAGIALLIATLASDAQLVVACVFVFVAIAVSLLPLNYGAFTVFLTPAFVLLAETQAGNADVVGERITNTALGAVIALLASRLILPLSERDQIRPLLGKALSDLEELLLRAADAPPDLDRVRAARRQLGIALLNAEASYQRLLTEMGIAPDQSEAALTLLLYAHRMASGLIAIVFARGTPLHERLSERVLALHAGLAAVREAITERREPAAVPEPAEADASQERVEVLFEQLSVMRTAALRFRV